MSPSRLPYWLAALHLPETGPRTFLRWLEHFPAIEKLFSATPAELSAAGLSPRQIEAVRQPDWETVDRELIWGETAGQHLLALDDPVYPALLKEISDPPLVLYVRGDIAALSKTQLAMVGSRHATHAGLKTARAFAAALAQAGLVVTSGLAVGIDGASHRGAVEAGGITLAVTGTGLDQIYPRVHRELAEDIIAHNGAVISEFSLAMPALPANFPRRNRVIAGLSVGVLVVEAALQSGSLITARHALESGREVFAIPGSIHHPQSRGCHHLIRQGAKLVETAADVLEELRAYPVIASPAPDLCMIKQGELSAECRQMLEQIGYEITPMDMIVLRSGLTAGAVSSILLVLELNGYIQSVPGGYVREVLDQQVG